jgi:hypothetical protein
MYIVGDRTELWGTPACIFFSVDISPSTETLNLRSEVNEQMSLILDKLQSFRLHLGKDNIENTSSIITCVYIAGVA